MSPLEKLMDNMCLSDGDEDDYFLDDEEYDDDKPARKGLFGKKDESFYGDEDEEDESAKPRFLPRNKVVPMKQRIDMEVSMAKPTPIEDTKEICDYLLAGKVVVPNMEGLHTEVAQRVIDFTPGVACSTNGNSQKTSNYISVVTPESVELSGDFQDLFGDDPLDISGMNLRI